MLAMALQIGVINIVFILIGMKVLVFEQWTANTFIMSVFAEVAALVLLVVKYLFARPDDTLLRLAGRKRQREKCSIDFRGCLYALSDVIINRPTPLRVFDQIYMKLPDMLLQAELISRWFNEKRVAFIGDGDAVALTLAHLSSQDLLRGRPERIEVFDFDSA